MFKGFATEEEMQKAWKILKETGAYREGHFYFQELGFHYNNFFQLPLAFQYSRYARILSVILGRILRRAGILNRFDKDKRFTIITPVEMGIPVAFWTGENLGADRVLWATRYDDKLDFPQFVEISEKDQVIIVLDILFTGKLTMKLIDLIYKKGASIESIAVIVDKREKKVDFKNIPVLSLLEVEVGKYDPANCPLCQKDMELTEVRLI
ncbi:MAG: hypothetical protein ACE5QV_03050 [Fidelibacterota bacterium]